jgi:hypothetical protein
MRDGRFPHSKVYANVAERRRDAVSEARLMPRRMETPQFEKTWIIFDKMGIWDSLRRGRWAKFVAGYFLTAKICQWKSAWEMTNRFCTGLISGAD